MRCSTDRAADENEEKHGATSEAEDGSSVETLRGGSRDAEF